MEVLTKRYDIDQSYGRHENEKTLLQLVLAHDQIGEESVEDIEPYIFLDRRNELDAKYDPTVIGKIANMQGFKDFDEWHEEWLEAGDIAESMARNRKPTTEEIKADNEHAEELYEVQEWLKIHPIPETRPPADFNDFE